MGHGGSNLGSKEILYYFKYPSLWCCLRAFSEFQIAKRWQGALFYLKYHLSKFSAEKKKKQVSFYFRPKILIGTLWVTQIFGRKSCFHWAIFFLHTFSWCDVINVNCRYRAKKWLSEPFPLRDWIFSAENDVTLGKFSADYFFSAGGN